MKRLVLALILCALAVTTVSAAVSGGSLTIYAKHVTDSGETHALDGGYVMYATHTLYGGFSPWRYCWINSKGMCRIDLPLPLLCWSGTDICTTLDGQTVYWTLIPPHYGECTLREPATGAAALSGVTWIATQNEAIGTVWSGRCEGN
jgi:hypothetical protein